MKAAVDSEAGQGEIKEMKFEIHRMKVRFAELMKQQEKLVREMESSVSRRDTIITRGDHINKDPKVVTQGKLQREINETQKKIKETSAETSKLEIEIGREKRLDDYNYFSLSDQNTLSKKHAIIFWDFEKQGFYVRNLSKNKVSIELSTDVS